MKYSEVERRLRKEGCYFLSHGGNHGWWYSPITNRRFLIPRHKNEETKLGTLKAIGEQSGVKFRP